MRSKHLFLWLAGGLLPLIAATPAAAYVGPGAGLSLLSALWGVVVAVGAAAGFVILWPFRHLLRKRRVGGGATARADAQGTPASSPDAERPSSNGVSRHGAV